MRVSWSANLSLCVYFTLSVPVNILTHVMWYVLSIKNIQDCVLKKNSITKVPPKLLMFKKPSTSCSN